MKTLSISTSIFVLLFWVALVLALVLPTFVFAGATVTFDDGTVTGTLDTDNGVLVGEGSLDTTTGETTESHCLTTQGHTSGDLCLD